MSEPTQGPRIGVVGANGRLGSRLVAACRERGLPLALAATRESWEPLTPEPPTVVLDASRGAVIGESAEYCRRTGAALVACASDLGEEGSRELEKLAGSVPVVLATNLSVGHWLQGHLLDTVARIVPALPAPPEASVVERHTTAKRDRPSASARALAERWAAHGHGPVGDLASVRGGHPVSEHQVEWTFPAESLTLRHEVRSLDAAVFGALTAAAWTHTASPG